MELSPLRLAMCKAKQEFLDQSKAEILETRLYPTDILQSSRKFFYVCQN